jgi:N-methylhydantoinase A/oxoprolinase/acetone carboxylase beta subunit
MLLGIDVGGTFTDAVLIGRGTIIAQAKRKTTHEAVLQGILEALDEVLQEQEVVDGDGAGLFDGAELRVDQKAELIRYFWL